MAKKFLDYDGLEEVAAQIKSLLLGKEDTISLTASKAVASDSNGKLVSSSTTATELGYLSGVTSAIQTQLNAKQAALTAGENITIAVNQTTGNLEISAEPGVEKIDTATNIWALDYGVYYAYDNCLRYKSGTLISTSQNNQEAGILKVLYSEISTIDMKNYIFITSSKIYYGRADSSSGTCNYKVIADIEQTTNKVTSLSDASTDTQYPSAKAVYDQISPLQESVTTLEETTSGINNSSEGDFNLEKDFTNNFSVIQLADSETSISGEDNSGDNRWLMTGAFDYETGEPRIDLLVETLDDEDLNSASFSLSSNGASYNDDNTDGEGFLINGNPVATRTWTNTQLSGKQATITGAASTITTSDLTANRALVSDSNGKVAVSAVTGTELGYLDGVTSAIQTQIDNKVAKTSTAKQLYGTDNASTPAQTTLTYGTTATVDYIVQRTAGGQITVPVTPSADTDAASKGFVNSTVGTNTANFIGTFENIPALNAYSGTVTNNDYAYVINSVITDNGNDWASSTALNNYNKALCTNFDYAWVINGAKFDLYRFDVVEQAWSLRVQNTAKADVTLNTAYNRYKATVASSTVTWEYEFTLNNSSFTNAQWQAINSGITSTLVTQIGTNQSDISTLNGQVANKRDKITVASKIYSTDGSGNQSSLDYGTAATANYVVQRRANGSGETGGNGQITVPSTPVANTDAASKTYVDTGLSGKVAQVATANQVYITNSSGTSTTASQGTAFNKNFETSTTNIKMNGNVSVGSSSNIARADHVHPTDTTRQATYTASSNDWDTTPTASSTKPVTSGGVYTALAGKEDTMTAITTQEIDNLFNS